MNMMQGNAQGLGMFRTVVGITAIGVLLGACTSPTYGTGKTAAEQLVDDLGNATSITGDQTKRNLKYGPRPASSFRPSPRRTAGRAAAEHGQPRIQPAMGRIAGRNP